MLEKRESEKRREKIREKGEIVREKNKRKGCDSKGEKQERKER